MSTKETDLTADEKAQLEGTKLMFEAIKHLITLSMGIILISIALLEKFFTAPHWRIVIAASIFFLSLSAVVAVRLMVSLSAFAADRTRTDPGVGFYRATVYSFILGVILLAVFIIRNLWK